MNRRLLLIAAILALALAIAEFIKVNYSRFTDATAQWYLMMDVFLTNTSDAAITFLTVHKYAMISGIAALVVLRIALALWRLHIREISIATNFHLAEAELNGLIRSFRSHKGRIGRSKERAEWYRDIAKKELPVFHLGDPFPRTVSDHLIELNEFEIQWQRKKKNDCIMTAFLLAQLYRAAPEAARAKIEAERKRGHSPYIAAGIESLSNENWRLLRYVVRKRGFP